MSTASAMAAATGTARRHLEKAHLPARCYIVRRVSVQDDAGGMVDSWRRILRDVPCRVRPPRAMREALLADRPEAQADAEILLPVTVYDRASGKDVPLGIEEEDRIEVVPNPVLPLVTTIYEILGVADDVTDPLLLVARVKQSE